ncbi:MAG: D-2-hydroxyacid dehydrogenase [Planctomycetes bacterium]|nr:D-2-hydroxyacid dehydrogenase [Planctomycetota bacterium]
MIAKPAVHLHHWIPDGQLSLWTNLFPQFEFVVATSPEVIERRHADAVICYGFSDLHSIERAPALRWVQLASAGVPKGLCPLAQRRGLTVSNLAGLYGPTIAEHALAMMLTLSRNLHVVQRNQTQGSWDRSVAQTMRDLHGRTLALVGLGNIGQNIARLGRAFGMRVVGCRRRPQPTPFVDAVVAPNQIRSILAEADVVAVAAPLTAATEGMLNSAEFEAMRPGSFYINVSRGPIAQEAALLQALRSGKLAGAGLDVFAVEPLPADHPFWTMSNVFISPHYSGETVNNSSLPAERFTRNLRRWLAQQPPAGLVDLDQEY